MANILTIAKKLIQEALRSYGFWGMLLFVLILMLLIPNQLQSDDTLRGKIQLVMNYSLILTAIFINSISLFFSCYSFTQELKTKQYYLLDAKPLHRWQFFWGKFVGIAIVNLILLTILSFILYGFILYIQKYQGTAEERQQLTEQLLIAYRGVMPEEEQTKIDNLVRDEYLKLKKEGKLSSQVSDLDHINEIRSKIILQEQSLYYRQSKSWNFFSIPTQLRDTEQNLRLRYKVLASDAIPGYQYLVHWEFGQGHTQYVWEGKINFGEMLELSFPAQTIQPDNTLQIKFAHIDPQAGVVYFPLMEGIELCYPAGSFTANYIKNLILMYGISCFLAVMGLFLASFLNFSVALFSGLFVLLIGSVANFALEIFSGNATDLTWLQIISQSFLQVLLCIIPDFSQYSGGDSLAIGRVIELSTVLGCLVKLFLRIAILGSLGCWLFKHREIGNPAQ